MEPIVVISIGARLLLARVGVQPLGASSDAVRHRVSPPAASRLEGERLKPGHQRYKC